MAENLKVTHYRNGDPIYNITNQTEWMNLSTGAYCAYDNNQSYVNTYSYLYNWYAVNDNRNITPTGWHIPTDIEWKVLEMYLGMSQSQANGTSWRGTDEGGKLKETGTAHWTSPNSGATNESGLTVLPAGYRDSNGYFNYVKIWANFWSSDAWYRMIHYEHSTIVRNNYSVSKKVGCSIRCVKD
jgi:uncharacterized protein (TIGR02145 family)